MSGSNGLTCSVSELGIFVHFIASDGSETQIDALTVLDCSTAMTNRPLLHWCRERLKEVAPYEIPEGRRWELLAAIDEVAAAKEIEFELAEVAGAALGAGNGDAVADAGEWLERAERMPDASAVLLTKEAFRALLLLARKGASLSGSSKSMTSNLPGRAWDCCS